MTGHAGQEGSIQLAGCAVALELHRAAADRRELGELDVATRKRLDEDERDVIEPVSPVTVLSFDSESRLLRPWPPTSRWC